MSGDEDPAGWNSVTVGYSILSPLHQMLSVTLSNISGMYL